MALLTGAISSIGPKLLELLKDEYNLQKGLRKQVKFVSDELDSVDAALRKVAEVPWDQLDEQVKVWARQVREASYDMEDILDAFLVNVEGNGSPKKGKLKRTLRKMGDLFSKGKARHDIAGAIEEIKMQLQVVSDRRARYKVDEIVAKPAATSTVDPRLEAMYKQMTQLIGIDKSRKELISMLSSSQEDDEVSEKKMKIVSVFGVGGLGKTTLAKAVYDELKPQFDCGAFVPVGRNPDLKKVFRDILLDLDQGKYMLFNWDVLDERQLINELRDLLQRKSYFIVIDDVWETKSWEKIKLALMESYSGSRIITTTRKLEVATDDVYKLQPLSYDNSKLLLYTRIFGVKGKCRYKEPDEVTDKVLKKCDGIPLAIITMACLLVSKSREEWSEVYRSINFGDKDNQQVESTMKILAFSYYDLPSHLKTCLLYLSVFPEDYVIDTDLLIWKWIAEGFVQEKQGTSLFEVGEGYFNDLINRSMIQAVDYKHYGNIMYGCRVHDMVLDLLRYLSHEENFVTILDNSEGTILCNPIRRLACQIRMEHTLQDNLIDLPLLRSFIDFGCDIGKCVVSPRTFKLLRVLSLEHWRSREGCYDCLKHLGSLVHLRYLSIRDTAIDDLPEEIGALKFLQILDFMRTEIRELPYSIGQLTQLVCLRAYSFVTVPDGVIWKLTSLEELQINLRDDNDDESRRQFVKDLGNLRQLRVLGITIRRMDESVLADLVQSLCSLDKIQHLTLVDLVQIFSNDTAKKVWDVAVLPRHIRHLDLVSSSFKMLPACINPKGLPSLSHLEIHVHTMDEQGLKMLGGLPELRYLELMTSSTARLANVAADGCFPKLRSFLLPLSTVNFVANEDSSVSFTIWDESDDMAFVSKKKEECRVAPAVMPNLQELEFKVKVRTLRQNNGSCDNLGLEYLPSLHKVRVGFDCYGAFSEDVDEEEKALRRAIEDHPNQLKLQIDFWYKESTKSRAILSSGEEDEVSSAGRVDEPPKGPSPKQEVDESIIQLSSPEA